jgi:hypothetical protein
LWPTWAPVCAACAAPTGLDVAPVGLLPVDPLAVLVGVALVALAAVAPLGLPVVAPAGVCDSDPLFDVVNVV